MKLLFFGDSITDMGRSREPDGVSAFDYGISYVFRIAGELLSRPVKDYQILNRGIAGDSIVSLYQRLKPDVWVQKPDVLTILIGVNDLWHDIDGMDIGVELPRFQKVYRALIEETRERLPDIQIILAEPFVLPGTATDPMYDRFLDIEKYAQAVRELAGEYGLYFLPLQEAFRRAAAQTDAKYFLYDGIHPGPAGAKLIADAWLALFDGMNMQPKACI